jgi:formylmethanofuran dehydrogenase subunit E
MEQAVNTKTSVQTFEELLAGSVAAHGHLCPGQIVGVRMGLLGLRLLDFEAPPTYRQLKQLIVFIEMDRCTGDAVANVTNVKLGRRSLKFVDYGIMAATFINLETHKAYRIVSTEESRDLAPLYAPQEPDKRSRQLEAYRVMPDSVMFRVQEVEVNLTRYDLPGPTRSKVTCVRCGQVVRDCREVIQDGQALCRPCAGGAYFKNAREIIWESMDWSPQTQVQTVESPAHLSRFILSKRPH